MRDEPSLTMKLPVIEGHSQMLAFLRLLRLAVFFGIASVFPQIGRADQETPVLAVFVESHGLVAPGRDRGPTLMVAIWPDGRIVWSRDQLNGGAPFLTARVELRQVAALIERAEGDRVFEAGSFRHSWFGPDSAFTTIWVRSGNRHTRLQSWHEGFEQRPTLVALSSGVTSLAGRTREEALRSDTKEYQHFRRLWGDLRASIAALVPKQGTPYIEATKLDLPK